MKMIAVESPRAFQERGIQPYFIVPLGFRPNTLFIGRGEEYSSMDKWLSNARLIKDTTYVYLYGEAGIGKTQLARQYVFRCRWQYKRGVFWIPAHSLEEVNHTFRELQPNIAGMNLHDDPIPSAKR